MSTMLPNTKADCEPSDLTNEEVFQDIYFMILFFACLWLVGKISARLGPPSLVGEIVTGIVLGPNLLDLVPKWDALMVIGDIALILLVVEAGIGVNMGVLKVVGTRGLMIAIFGSMFPLLIGTFLTFLIVGIAKFDLLSAVAIGACFAPTSTGIALNLLRTGGVLNTPTGQLIIAAAVFDDVIALMLLSILQELSGSDPSIFDIVMGFIVSPALILIFGFVAIRISPSAIKFTMDKIDIKYHEYGILCMLFSSILLLVPACYYAKSSYLLGAFLAGLMFCTDHTIHHVWEKQMKRIMHWILRIFFSCTIGFEIPIKDFFTNPNVVVNASIYFICIIGKYATGFFATSKPIKIVEFFTISFSMGTWCEFAFILTSTSYAAGLMDQDTMTSVLMAVLFSVIISPSLLTSTLKVDSKHRQVYVQRTRKQTMRSSHIISEIHTVSESAGHSYLITPTARSGSPTSAYLHHVYYCIHTKTYGKWGHQNRLLKALYKLKLEIIDFRAFNEPQDNYSHHSPYVQDIFYVKDNNLHLLPTKQLHIASKRQLGKRARFIRNALKVALQDDDARVVIMRWLPGIRQKDDMSVSVSKGDGIQRKANKKRLSVEYVRNEAYRQSRMALSYSRFPFLKAQSSNKNNIGAGVMENKMDASPPAVSYLSRITSADVRTNRRRVSFVVGNVLDGGQDDLIKLSFVDEGDVDDIEEEKTEMTSNISLEIMYGDFHEEPIPQQPLDTISNSSIPVIKWSAPVTPNPATPLLE